MNGKVKYIILAMVLCLISVEMYIIMFLKVNEDKSVPVVAKETKVTSINKIYDEIMLIGGITILESKTVDNILITNINIKGSTEEVLEKTNSLKSYRIINYKISRKEEKIDLNMEIIKK